MSGTQTLQSGINWKASPSLASLNRLMANMVSEYLYSIALLDAYQFAERSLMLG